MINYSGLNNETKKLLDFTSPNFFVSATPISNDLTLSESAATEAFHNLGTAGTIMGDTGFINSSDFIIPYNSIQDSIAINQDSIFSLWQAVTTNHYLVDAGTSYRELAKVRNQTFTTAGVIAENSGWASCLRDNQVLNSYTKEDFRNNGGSITLTAFDNSGPEATVSFNESSNILCGNCGRATVSLSSGSNMVHACVSFSETSNTADFGLIVRTVAFPQIFTLITNECCLGWSSRNFNSFTTEKNIYWKYYSKFEEIIK